MTKYVGKIFIYNSKRLLNKLEKILGVIFLPHNVAYSCMFAANCKKVKFR